MNETEVISTMMGVAKWLPSPLDVATWELLVLFMIRFNLDKCKKLINGLYYGDKKDFDDLLSFMNNIDKTDSHQKPSSYRHAIEAFELPSWMELRSEVGK